MIYTNSDDEAELGHKRPSSMNELGRFAERLKIAIGERSDSSVAKLSGLAKGTIHNLTNGGTPSFKSIERLSSALGVTSEWLALGIEPMRETSESARSSAEVGNSTHYDESDFATAPFYDVDASCGHGAWNDNAQIISQLAFRRDWLRSEGLEASSLAAIRARGDSMAPTIQSGDTLLVDLRVNTPRNDGIYIIEQDGGISAKRIQRAPDGSLYIRSDNKAYQDFHIPQGHPLKIIGRLAWFGRRVD